MCDSWLLIKDSLSNFKILELGMNLQMNGKEKQTGTPKIIKLNQKHRCEIQKKVTKEKRL